MIGWLSELRSLRAEVKELRTKVINLQVDRLRDPRTPDQIAEAMMHCIREEAEKARQTIITWSNGS